MITHRPFGTLADGTAVTCYRLSGSENAYVDILDYGATIQSIVVPDQNGNPTDVVLGHDTAQEYAANTMYLGATVGRHANRIKNGQFTLNGVTYSLEINSGPNHSHGGLSGYHQRMFAAEIQGDTLTLRLTSPDGDQGYPGTLQLAVSFTFSPDNALTIHYLAETDKDTVINLTNHSYFDLSAGANPMGQLLQMDAVQYTENDENTLPTGVISPVAGTPFDFTTEKPLRQDLNAPHEQLILCNGYDHNFVLENGGEFLEFARLRSPITGIAMTAGTDLPGVQLYTGNFLDGPGKGGTYYRKNRGVCLETQFFPNAMAVEYFQKPILRAGEIYDHVTVYKFHTT